MTALPFAPSPPTDLVLPERGSTTARAVSSLALRKLFEWVKSAAVPGADPALEELRAIVAGFLPGKPKTVAALLAAPSVAAPLRLLRLGGGDPALLGRAAVEAAQRHLAGAPAVTELREAGFIARGFVVARSTAPFFLEWPERDDLDLGDFVDELRRGHALLSAALPGVAGALERAGRVVIPTNDPPGVMRVDAHAPSVIGIAREPSAEALAGALARATPASLLLSLRELDAIADDEAFERLVAAASAAVDARLAEVLVEKSRSSVDPEPRRKAFSTAFHALVAFERALTPVGAGIFGELARRAGYDPGPEPTKEGDQ